MNTFQIPRPQVPIQLFLLAALDVAGFLALWLAAYHAFSGVAGPFQAFFAATLIEAGMVIEALALIKRPKVWYTWLGVIFSLVVSGGYNYIQAATAVTVDGVITLNPFLLLTLALGPLSALCFVSLTLGHELREYQEQSEKWTLDRAAWFEARRIESEQRQVQLDQELQARLERVQHNESERQERVRRAEFETQRNIELARLENERLETERRFQAEQSERDWQRKQTERTQKLEQRKERLAEQIENQHEPAADLTQPDSVPAEPLQEPLPCETCERTFGSQSALNAHRRFCAGRKSQIEPNTEPIDLAVNGISH